MYIEWSTSTSKEDKLAEDKMLPEDSFNLRYIDWSSSWNERGYPVVLDERDLENLRVSKDLFARKFDVEKSAGLLELINQELLQLQA